MNRIMESCIHLAKSYRLFTEKDAPVRVPSNFIFVGSSELQQNNILFDSLISCYRNVFGSEDIWGEGARCNRCKKLISLESYHDLCKSGKNTCDCGHGYFELVFQDKELKERIIRELDPINYSATFCILMLQDAPNNVVGFSWGAFDWPDRIAERIVMNRFNRTAEEADYIRQAINNGPFGKKRIHFFDELGVFKSARGGLIPVISLTRLAFEKAVKIGVTSCLFWTSRKSPIYNICKLVGFDDLFETADGIVFIYLEDTIPLLTLFQNVDPKDFPSILKGNMKYL